ncbi:hypothetical protein TWF281_003726 [Arthrobotrys megalospora]
MNSGKESDIFILEQCKLMRIFDDRDASDVTVTVGSKGTVFYLHRLVICLTSGFFKAALKPNTFKEGITNEIHLPEIKSEAFKVISRWMYDGGLALEPAYGAHVQNVYDAADYLQMPTLKEELLDHLLKFTRNKSLALLYSQRKDLFCFFIRFCNSCSTSDLGKLTKCAEFIILRLRPKPEELFQQIIDNSAGHLFTAAVIGAAQTLRLTSLCINCHINSDRDAAEGMCGCGGRTVQADIDARKPYTLKYWLG